MTSVVPPLNSKGFFQVASPWQMPANVIYECSAIRDFIDFATINEDVFKLVYAPKDISREKYEQDRAAGAKIISLTSMTNSTIYIPSTYLTGYPLMDNVACSRVVLGVDMGAIPDSIDLNFLLTQIKAAATDVIGVEPDVRVTTAPSDNYMTANQHAQWEVARQDKIANRTTDRARWLAERQVTDQLRQTIAAYEQIMRDAGIIPS
jgi:hypothetical protein